MTTFLLNYWPDWHQNLYRQDTEKNLVIDNVCSWYFGGVRGASTRIICMVVGANQLGAMNHSNTLSALYTLWCCMGVDIQCTVLIYSMEFLKKSCLPLQSWSILSPTHPHSDKRSLNQSGHSMPTVLHWRLLAEGTRKAKHTWHMFFPLQFIGENTKSPLNMFVTGLFQFILPECTCQPTHL